MCTGSTHVHSLVALLSKLDHSGMQTTEVIQASTAPFLAIAQMPGAPFKPYRDRLLRLSDVRFLTGLGRSSIYAAMAEGTFPGAVNVTGYAVAWRESEIDAWIAARTKVTAAPSIEPPTAKGPTSSAAKATEQARQKQQSKSKRSRP